MFLRKDYDKRLLVVDNDIYHPLNYVYIFNNTLSKKFCNNWGAIIKYQDLSFKIIGDHVGHIPNFMDKIDSYDFEPFTKSRLKVILEEYYKMNSFIEKDCKEISKNIDEIE